VSLPHSTGGRRRCALLRASATRRGRYREVHPRSLLQSLTRVLAADPTATAEDVPTGENDVHTVASVAGVLSTKPIMLFGSVFNMSTDTDSDSPSILTILGVVVALVAVVGTSFLGWEWGASFAEQPVPFVIGACAVIVALGYTLSQRL